MLKHQQEHQELEQIASIDAKKLLTASEEIELSREKVKFWRKQVQSLNLELREKDQLLQQTEEELEQTNHELRQLATMFAAERLTLDEALEVAKQILANGKLGREAIADLLGAIYLSPVKLWDIKPLPKRNSLTKANLNKYSEQQTKSIKKFNELGTRFVGLQATFAKIKAQHDVLKIKYKRRTETKMSNDE